MLGGQLVEAIFELMMLDGEAVAGDGGGNDTPRLQQGREPDLEREDDRLGEIGSEVRDIGPILLKH